MPSESSGGGFPKEERLLSRREFLRARRRGKKVQSRHLIAIALPSLVGRRRIGLTVSTKVGDAVSRNRVKRWLREIYRKDRESLPQGIDLVVIARFGAAESSFATLQKEFLGIAERLRDEGKGSDHDR